MYTYKVSGIKKIYDGDTVQLYIDLGFNINTLQTFRLALIDAPEVRGETRPEGLLSRDYLRARLYEAYDLGETIVVKTEKDSKGKYGRYIAEIFINGVSINRELVSEDLAIFKNY